MGQIAHIRKQILRVSQAELAGIAGVTQPTVSRWEREECEPSRQELSRIRSWATDKKIAWDDRWFFEAPSSATVAA